MTPEEISGRNRANAQKSTGPKSAQGKAVVSGNARRHGATSRPDPASVRTWLAIILDEPDLTPRMLMPQDERGVRALSLAQAEVQNGAAELALREFEAGLAKPSEAVLDLERMSELILEDLHYGDRIAAERRQAYRLLGRINKESAKERQLGGKRHRLLERYLREARARRRRALSAWLEVADLDQVA